VFRDRSDLKMHRSSRIDSFTSRNWHFPFASREPYAYDRRTWIDSSTHPVTVWYVDYNGALIRIQPLD